MSGAFYIDGRGKGPQTPTPCPRTPIPACSVGLSYFGDTLIAFGTYNGGRSLETCSVYNKKAAVPKDARPLNRTRL